MIGMQWAGRKPNCRRVHGPERITRLGPGVKTIDDLERKVIGRQRAP